MKTIYVIFKNGKAIHVENNELDAVAYMDKLGDGDVYYREVQVAD